MYPVSIGVLNQRRFAGLLVNRVNRNGVLAAAKHPLALEIGGAATPVAQVQEAAVRVSVDRARSLAAKTTRIRQRLLGEQRRGAERRPIELPIDLQLVLPLQRDEDERPCRMELEMARLEIVATPRRDRGAIGEHSIFVTKHL